MNRRHCNSGHTYGPLSFRTMILSPSSQPSSGQGCSVSSHVSWCPSSVTLHSPTLLALTIATRTADDSHTWAVPSVQQTLPPVGVEMSLEELSKISIDLLGIFQGGFSPSLFWSYLGQFYCLWTFNFCIGMQPSSFNRFHLLGLISTVVWICC